MKRATVTRHGWKAAIAVVVVTLLVALAWRLPVRQWIVTLADQIRGMGATGVALFIVVYVLAVVALLPGSVFTLAAGFAYGPVGGLLLVSPASVVGATLAFLLSRSTLRGWIQEQVAQYPKARALDRAIGKDSFRLILLLRLSPLIPFNVLNYALGLTDATVGRYILASFLGMLPGTWMYVYLGSLATTAAGLTEAARNGGTQRLVLTIAGRVAAVLVVVLVTRSARRALHEELKKP